jgi:single-strand DNA-binding protein
MRGFNQCTLIGNLGNDPEVKYLQDGTAVASLSLATTEKWKDKASGDPKERTEWHKVQVFGRLAEICGEYLHKGSAVFVQGSIRYRKVTGQDGVDRYYTDIRVDANGTIQFLDGKPQDTGERGRAPARRAAAPAPATDAGEDFADDDIPF